MTANDAYDLVMTTMLELGVLEPCAMRDSQAPGFGIHSKIHISDCSGGSMLVAGPASLHAVTVQSGTAHTA